MPELKQVPEDHARMKRSFTFLGITDVIELKDSSFDEMEKAYKMIY